ncbi:MAG: tetratricopeptide repeat protein [Deltaproteobacteria bacterium]|nr:tetratricopeptide repeat protein [Deltaproteobacteria bacterium]
MSRQLPFLLALAFWLFIALLALARAQEMTPDAQFQRSLLLEEAGRCEEALAVIDDLAAGTQSYAISLRRAWLNRQCGDVNRAELYYRDAARQCETCADPWLGLQTMAAEHAQWRLVLAYGGEANARDEGNYWAHVRGGYAAMMLDDLPQAAMHYQAALQAKPEDGEALLGLGYVRLRQGRTGAADELCERAAKVLPNDPRVTECLHPSPPEPSEETIYAAEAWGGMWTYSDPWNLSDTISLTGTVSVTQPGLYGGWFGVAQSDTTMRYQEDDFTQTVPVLGGWYAWGEWSVDGSAGYVFTNDDVLGDAPVGVLGGGYRTTRWGLHAEAAATGYDGFTVLQGTLLGHYSPIAGLTLTAGPRVISVGERDVELPEPATVDAETVISAMGRVDWQALPWLDFYAAGFTGEQRYAVDLGGLSVWSSADLFVGQIDGGVGVRPLPAWRIYASAHQKYGSEQYELDHDFTVTGWTLGTSLGF